MRWRLNKEKLLWLRLSSGWSQEEAAEHCNASDRKQYHLWETGKTQRPRQKSLLDIANGFHLNSPNELILKPSEPPTPDHQIFYDAHFGVHTSTQQTTTADSQIKAICFGLDNTLVHGYEFCWKPIWSLLDNGEQIRKQGLKSFHTGKMDYEQWCLWCCRQFRQQGISKHQLTELALQFKPISNLQQGLEKFKKANLRLAILSGSVDLFLDTLIPQHQDYFELSFTNRLVFDDQDVIQSIIPTPFDLQKKSDGIRYIAGLLELNPAQIAFVGNNFVDRYIINTVGRSYCFGEASDVNQELFDCFLTSKDFSVVADMILTDLAPATRKN